MSLSQKTASREAYVLKIPGIYPFQDVLEILKVNLFNKGWAVRDVKDVDIAVRPKGCLIHNKVLSVSRPECISDALKGGHMNALSLTQDNIEYQESKGVSPLSYGAKPGAIVIEFIEPREKSRLAKIEELPHGKDDVQDLTQAVEQTAEFFANSKNHDLKR